MRFGAVYPQQAVPHSAAAIADYAQAVEAAGLEYIVSFDHPVAADTKGRAGWSGYSLEDDFHEVFVLFGFLAAKTRLELVAGVMVLPQRQTALVAKQAADLDLLLEGRLRLGFAIGWNEVEYEALGVPFSTRAARLEEQIEVLRLLWTNESVTFEGKFHHIDRAGIAPLPLQRPIPIWLGGGATQRRSGSSGNDALPSTLNHRVLDRIGRIADGWITSVVTTEELAAYWKVIGDAAEAAGRDRASLGLQVISEAPTPANLDAFLAKIDAWREIGVTNVSLRTGAGRGRDLQEHLDGLAVAGKYIDRAKG